MSIGSVELSASGKYTLIVGDQRGFPTELLRRLHRAVDTEVSLGPVSYLAEHCIAFVNDLLDRAC